MATGNRGATKSFSRPDDHLSKGGVEIDIVQLGDVKVKRASYPPGWRFSERMGAPKCYPATCSWCRPATTPTRWATRPA